MLGGFVAAATIPLMNRSRRCTWISFDHCCTKKLQRSESDVLDHKQNTKFKLVLYSFTDWTISVNGSY